jgi:carboxyl-terminal processing protease
MDAMASVADAGPDDEDLVADAIGGMLSSLGDPYTRFLPREKYEALTSYATGGENNYGGGIGVQLLEDLRTGRMMVMATTVGGPAASAGMRPGDAIVRIDGADVAGYSAEVVAAKCRGATGGKVELDFVRMDDDAYDVAKTTARGGGGGVTPLRHLTLTRARIDSSNPTVASTFVSAGGRNVGLLKVPSFSTETASQIVDGLRSVATGGGGTGDGSVVVDAIAIDIRGNVGGYMPGGVDSAKLFLPAGLRVISEVGRPGGTTTTPSSSSSTANTKTYDSDGIGAETSLPLYLLVDKRTASASEIFAAALQDNGRAVVVGSTNTFGKGRIQNVRALGNGCGVAITRARYVTPRGRDLHGVGIVPDRVPDRCGIDDSARTCLAGIL